jgi:hypothetical protein
VVAVKRHSIFSPFTFMKKDDFLCCPIHGG